MKSSLIRRIGKFLLRITLTFLAIMGLVALDSVLISLGLEKGQYYLLIPITILIGLVWSAMAFKSAEESIEMSTYSYEVKPGSLDKGHT